jgi:hypothetical protein
MVDQWPPAIGNATKGYLFVGQGSGKVIVAAHGLFVGLNAAGACSFTAIGEWAAEGAATSVGRVGVRFDPMRVRHIAPDGVDRAAGDLTTHICWESEPESTLPDPAPNGEP